MHVHQLQDFALGDDVGSLRQDFHHPHAACLNHHLEGAGVEKISNQNTGWVAKRFVGCGSASAQRGCVDHVIMQQGCRVDELDHSCQGVAM